MLERTFSYAYNQTLREAIKEGMIKKHGTYDPKRLEVVERQYQKAGAVQKLPFSKVAQKVVEYAKDGNIVANLSCGTVDHFVAQAIGQYAGVYLEEYLRLTEDLKSYFSKERVKNDRVQAEMEGIYKYFYLAASELEWKKFCQFCAVGVQFLDYQWDYERRSWFKPVTKDNVDAYYTGFTLHLMVTYQDLKAQYEKPIEDNSKQKKRLLWNRRG